MLWHWVDLVVSPVPRHPTVTLVTVQERQRQMDDLIQDVPTTWSDERMHVLDETCWCKPTVDTDTLTLRHH